MDDRAHTDPHDEEGGLGFSERRRRSHDSAGHYDEAAEALIAPSLESEEVTKREKEEADKLVLSNLVINGVFIGLWYTFSLLISIYNKWMFSPEHLDFHFPLFASCLHMVVQFSLASLVLYFFPQFRPAGVFGGPKLRESPETTPLPGLTRTSEDRGFLHWNSSSEERRKREQGFMTKWVYLTKIGPCGAATGLDIGLGNMSLKFISLAFYTMCKSSSLAFVLLFAFAFKLEKITWKLVGIIGIMSVGVVLMVASEAQFVLVGFMLVITASALSGVRWSLTQMLLLRNPATANPFSSIFFLAPCMFFSILAIAIPVEGFGPLFERCGELRESHGIVLAFGLLLFPGVIAFLMVASEFALLKRSSVITLSICGIFKEVMTISAATIIFKDPLTPVNVTGLIITIISIACYNYMKVTKMRAEAQGVVHGAHHERPGHTASGYVAVGGEDEDLVDELGGRTIAGAENKHVSAVSVGGSSSSPEGAILDAETDLRSPPK